MPLRQRLRKALRRMSIGSAEDVEPVPKYKEPVDPEHRDRLEAFSFGSQRRRPSSQSQISPRASLAASRKGSMLSILSAGRRATQTAQQATVAEEAEGGVNDGHKEPVSLGHGKVGHDSILQFPVATSSETATKAGWKKEANPSADVVAITSPLSNKTGLTSLAKSENPKV